MLQQQAELRKAKSTKERAIRVEWCADHLTIDEDVFGLFAVVPSTSDSCKFYPVSINQETMTAESCQCDGFKRGFACVHYEATNLLLARCNMHLEPVAVEEVEQAATIEVNALLIKNKELYQSGQWNEDGDLTPVNAVVPGQAEYHAIEAQDAYSNLGATKQPVSQLSQEEQYERYRAFEAGIAGLGNVA